MRNYKKEYLQNNKNKFLFIIGLVLITLIMILACLFVGSSNMSIKECLEALFLKSSEANNRIIWKIRIPRIIAAVVAGAGLSISGLIMQTTLGNVMASPSTLGVSNASVFGANLSIIVFAGGFLSLGSNVNDYVISSTPFMTSLIAFIFAFISILIVLLLCKYKNYSPNSVVLAGIAIGAIWSAGTTILQFFATDVGLSAAVIWNFGDLGRATYKIDLIMFCVVFISSILFYILSWYYNALLGGDNIAKSIGVNVNYLRFISLLLSSLITAVCVSFLGIIGFVGIICPHIMKRFLGNNHKYIIPASLISGSLLLLIADTISRGIGKGTALPVGAITSILGAPFFLYIIFSKKVEATK